MTRGILKLDVLANLEYFSCFTMFSYNPEISKEYFVWVAIGSLFLISILIQAFGGYGTIITSKNWRYRAYFTLRFIIELIKVAIVVCVPVFNRILWVPLSDTFNDDFADIQYLTFLIFASLSVAFTLFTTVWSTIKIRKA